MVKITGLWKNKTAKGDDYLTATLGMAKILIFKNGYKEKETDPDYNMYFAPKQDPQGMQSNTDKVKPKSLDTDNPFGGPEEAREKADKWRKEQGS